MKKQLLRLLPVAAVLLTASCTDDQYDISNVDTESRFTAKGLVIPLNMSPIMLDNIISLNEDGDVKKDEKGNYYFYKKGKEPFESDNINVKKIKITKPADISQTVNVTIALDPTIQEKWETYAADKTIADIKADAALMSNVGLTEDKEIIKVDVNDKKSFNMNSTGIDDRITKIDKLGIDPLTLSIDVKLNNLQAVVDKVGVKGLQVNLPLGMTVTNITDRGTDAYTPATGLLNYGDTDIYGQKTIEVNVSELTYSDMESDGAKFDANAHTFTYNKECEVKGTATITFKDLKGEATLNDIKNAVGASYNCDVKFGDDLVVNSFSGGINYKVEDINIDPVEIKNLPEILQDPGTSLEVTNPQLYLAISNPFKDNNITATATLSITGNSTFEKTLTLDKKENMKVLSPKNESLYYRTFDHVSFPELGKILSGAKIPDALTIKVLNPALKADEVKDFELGKIHKGFKGTWEFYSRLSLTENTKVKYTKVWDDWGSKDLNGLTVEKAVVTFNVKKDVALKADKLEFFLLGKDAKDGKTERSLHGETTLTTDEAELNIPMTNGPIKDIYGGRLVVSLKGEEEGKDINTNQKIEISNLRMKVDGYYDKEF